MNYIEWTIGVREGDTRDELIAELTDFGFDSFAEEPDRLKGYLPCPDHQHYRHQLETFLRTKGYDFTVEELEERDWNAQWESCFEPIDIEGRCRIRAPFHPVNPSAELDIQIMPKMSFGTGHHATTVLMCTEMMHCDLAGKSGLDMGSGTGVLAILAIRLGAKHMDAVDIDSWAYKNGTENVERNSVEQYIDLMQGDVSLLRNRRYDFILANINRNILLSDMPVYVETLREGGELVVSGILESDLHAITLRGESLGLKQYGCRKREGWIAIRFIKEK